MNPTERQKRCLELANEVAVAYDTVANSHLEDLVYEALTKVAEEKDVDHAINCFGWRQELETWKSGCVARDEQIKDLQEQVKKLTHDLEIARFVISNDVDTDERGRKTAKKVLTEFEVEGDSYGVPTIADIIEVLVNKNSQLLDQVKRLRNILEWVRQENVIAGKLKDSVNDVLSTHPPSPQLHRLREEDKNLARQSEKENQ